MKGETKWEDNFMEDFEESWNSIQLWDTPGRVILTMGAVPTDLTHTHARTHTYSLSVAMGRLF